MLGGTTGTPEPESSQEPGVAGPAVGGVAGAQASRSGGDRSESVDSPASVSAGEPDEGLGIEAFTPGRLADEVPESLLGSLLLIVAVLLLALAVLPRVAIPDPRLGRLLGARRVELAAVGASLFLGVLLVVGLA